MSEQEKQYRRMTETPIPKLVTSLAFPTIVSMLVTSVYNMTDMYFVSQLGTSASGAVGILYAVQALIQTIGFTLGMGAGSLNSRKLGKKDGETASRYASSALAAAFVLGGSLGGVGLAFLEPMMVFFGATGTILPFAKDYGFYILLAAPIMCASFVLNNVLRAEGKATLSMVGIAVGSVLNIFLDWLFIFPLEMGIAGAAIATAVGQLVSFVVLFCYCKMGKCITQLRFRYISRRLRDYWQIIYIGSPTLFRQGLASAATTLLNYSARPYGDAVIAAMSIATKIYMILRGVVIGIGQGYQPVAGYNYGAGRYDRIKKAFWFTTVLGTAFSVVMCGVVFFSAGPLITLFRRDDAEVIRIGTAALNYLAVSLPFLAYSTYVNQTFQCLGKALRATLLASCRQGIFYIPLILLLPRVWGIFGIQITQTAADILTFAVSIPFHIHFFKKHLTSEPGDGKNFPGKE